MDRTELDSQTTDSWEGRSYSRAEALARLGSVAIAVPTLSRLFDAAALAAPQAPPVRRKWNGIPGPRWRGGRHGGRAVVPFSDASFTGDPINPGGWADYWGANPSLQRGLFFFSSTDKTPHLDLLDSMDVSSNAKQYLFKLKRGVTFHNGRTMTAEDVKFTLERASNKNATWTQAFLNSVQGWESFAAGHASSMSGIRVVNKYTLELRLSRPDVTIPTILATQPFFILPKKEALAPGFNYLLGTGPYKLKSLDTSRRTLTVTRFKDYVYAPQLPYFDELEFEWGVDPNVQFLGTQKGDYTETGNAISSSALFQAAANPHLKSGVSTPQALNLVFCEFDVTKAPFNDIRVRQAFNYAVNRKRLQDLALLAPTGHFWPRALFCYDPTVKVFPYDPDRAKSLLQQAGYGSGLALTLPLFASYESRFGSQLEQSIQQDLKNVGVTINIARQPGLPTTASAVSSFRFWAKGWAMGIPDPVELTAYLTQPGGNLGGYQSARVKQLAATGQVTVDPARRKRIYADIERTMIADAAMLFLGDRILPFFKGDTLRNFQWDPVIHHGFDREWSATG